MYVGTQSSGTKTKNISETESEESTVTEKDKKHKGKNKRLRWRSRSATRWSLWVACKFMKALNYFAQGTFFPRMGRRGLPPLERRRMWGGSSALTLAYLP